MTHILQDKVQLNLWLSLNKPQVRLKNKMEKSIKKTAYKLVELTHGANVEAA